MRHKKKRHKLGLPADQRRALLRSLTTQVLKHGRVETTEAKAKAVKAEVERMITLAKRGKEDLNARRLVSSYLLENRSSKPVVLTVEKKDIVDETKYRVVKRDEKSKQVKAREKTIAQRLFETIAPGYADRNGGYVRVLHLPPRRGDGAPMALVELV
ncbi:50S ribosomal protein L17 [bacterium (Candidatus Blackallbacteria) CG17_big_fil_post_rev_8_21_14_2_50_48_46]|uniref:Large ribosomal subunit protein bL17 n=1 Tax=bacterium (Candidatus Blackallbacteria) CG17_big_fil_post_rev_8_21_14_2_50_48_46 TaxID=2014261 RepID=A0A2M7G8I0_9BACT|nr:MAG: 50S ribosomal protein L17 [bacterium (Candidatus Blackallbacteria) CG18_big_fil_WC_8_21_14_2_50_49_26]PIW18106.1 MAG: 50S ribosomal protein L17 [bacterium (Candidatus Blackallbacteria) CG17_big_fil_post_rev_8_21_14_2_50_48_46]PIW51115.1 MAG: 50S ribosomal protein L17 [bacterium (Candidatus Blackallbacteria) CG13_big_fil_rev_8_21_14_2_50_49_14]